MLDSDFFTELGEVERVLEVNFGECFLSMLLLCAERADERVDLAFELLTDVFKVIKCLLLDNGKFRSHGLS